MIAGKAINEYRKREYDSVIVSVRSGTSANKLTFNKLILFLDKDRRAFPSGIVGARCQKTKEILFFDISIMIEMIYVI